MDCPAALRVSSRIAGTTPGRFWPKRWNGKTISMEPRPRNSIVLAVFLAVIFAAVPLTAQQDCLDGIINGSFGINATITLCPKLASQVPGLQNRLTEIAAAQGEQKDQIRELKRLITSLNSVGRNIGEQRQIELLKNFSAQISGQQAAGQKQTQERIADLADQLDDLKTLLVEKLGNAGTRDKTTAAIDGPVGDAIAKFDLAQAHDLLEDIRAQLNVIGGKVDESLKQEKDIKGDTAATRQILEQEEAAEKEQVNDPASFARVTMYANKARFAYGGNWRIMAAIASSPPLFRPFSNPSLQIAFSKSGQKSWAFNVVERTGGGAGDYWQLTTDELGEKATLCLTVRDSRTGVRRQWAGKYDVYQNGTRATFSLTGDPTLTPAQDGLCGGATELRQPLMDPLSTVDGGATARAHTALPPHAATPASSGQSTQDLLAKVQQQAQQQQDDLIQAQKAARTSPAGFGKIEITTARINGGWWVTVFTAPANFVYTTFYDMKVQMVMKGAGRVWSVPLSNREVVTSGMEKRGAALRDLGTEAVVCFTAKDPSRPQPMRMTKWFSIDANGNIAAFVPSREPTLAVASDAPCE
jgi:hypothetical protein